MNMFEEGFSFYQNNSGDFVGNQLGRIYVNNIQLEIDKLTESINKYKVFDTGVKQLKGNVAEQWHAGTFNINAAVKGSKHRLFVDESNKHASTDISSNFGQKIGSKFYENGAESAKQQSKNLIEKYYEKPNRKESLEEFINRNKQLDENAKITDSIYYGQVRLIPKGQLVEAQKYLERKIAEESSRRPELVSKYQETLKMLKEKVSDGKGVESIPITVEDAEQITKLAKEGGFKPEDMGLNLENIIHVKDVLNSSIKAGITSATITMVLKIAPEIIKAIEYLIKTGQINEEQWKVVGLEGLSESSVAFIRGTVSAAITTCCKAGFCGSVAKSLDPSIVGMIVVLAMDTIKYSQKVASGQMTRYEMTNELIKETFVSACAFGTGAILQVIFGEVPVVVFLLGSFVGSVLGSVLYEVTYRPFISFCVDTGFTCFGLVDQDYELPQELIKEIGIEVFEYEKFEYEKFQPEQFAFQKFEFNKFEYSKIEYKFLRRGVIGVSRIGYV